MFNWLKKHKDLDSSISKMSSEKSLEKALDHIMKICEESGTRTKRIRWIEHRCKCVLYGGDWREADYPRNHSKRHID